MAVIPDYMKFTRTLEDAVGLKSLQDSLAGSASAFLRLEEQRQRDIARLMDVGKATGIPSSFRTIEDQVFAHSQVTALSDAARMATQPSFAESMGLIQNQALQNIVKQAMPDTKASLRALIGNVPTSIEAITARLTNTPAAYSLSIDPFAAYGPFVHIRPEPPSWDVWRDKGQAYSWGESNDTQNESGETLHDYYEQTESGIYVPKGGRPPGPSILTKSRFLETFQMCAQTTGQPPTMETFSEFMETHFEISISVSTIQRYCRTWKLLWRDLRNHIANC